MTETCYGKGGKPRLVGFTHRKFSQTPNRTFVCDECGDKFKTSNALSEHVKGVHVNEPSTCEICGKVFPNPRKLQMHQRTHQTKAIKPIEEWQCEICNKGLGQLSLIF